jgi:anti-sigma B factor antagonist
MLDVKFNETDDILTVELEGDLDNMTSPGLEEQIETRREGVRKIVIDASKLGYISSAGLRVIMATELYMREAGKERTQLINANDVVLEIIELCKFDNVVEVVK